MTSVFFFTTLKQVDDLLELVFYLVYQKHRKVVIPVHFSQKLIVSVKGFQQTAPFFVFSRNTQLSWVMQKISLFTSK